jgi:hypothetical protein
MNIPLRGIGGSADFLRFPSGTNAARTGGFDAPPSGTPSSARESLDFSSSFFRFFLDFSSAAPAVLPAGAGAGTRRSPTGPASSTAPPPAGPFPAPSSTPEAPPASGRGMPSSPPRRCFFFFSEFTRTASADVTVATTPTSKDASYPSSIAR